MINKKIIIYILILFLSIGTYSAIKYYPYIKLGLGVYKETKTTNLQPQEENHMMPNENPFYKYIDKDKIVEKPESNDEEVKIIVSGEDSDEENNSNNTPNKTVVTKTPSKKPLTSNSNQIPEEVIAEEEAPTFDEIANKYYYTFKTLETQMKTDLDNLITQAVVDYNNKKYRKLRLVQVYLDKGNQLEAEADRVFNSTLLELESILDEHSYDKSILSEIEDYYISYKKSQKQEIIGKGMAIVNGK